MTIPLSGRPQLEGERAREILATHFGVTGTLEPLASERDVNFRVRGDDGIDRLLKFSNRNDTPRLLAMQDELLQRLARADTGFAFPAPLADAVELRIGDAVHVCRLLSWVEGTPLAGCRPQPPALLREVGTLMGAVAEALLDYTHPEARRSLQWDPLGIRELCDERLGAIADDERRRSVVRWLGRIEDGLAAATETRRSVIHNDANDHNLICGPMRDRGHGWRRSVVGLVDVGDAIEGPTAAECAVAMAYAMLGREDPVAAAAAVAAGFHDRLPLEEREIELLFPLAIGRLCLSVCNSAAQRREERGNAYLSVSERAAWETLARLATESDALAHYRLRAACGLEPCPRGPEVRGWLAANRASVAPILERRPEGVHVFDLSVGSTEMGGGAPGAFDTAALTGRLFGLLREHDAELGMGRYDEARCWYGGELFAGPGNDGPRRRTVHVGIDLFLPAGTPLRAPLAGRVRTAVWNRGRLDYGPTVVLEHEPEPGLVFWTLWGHLDPECLERLQPGGEVAAGDRLARIGDYPDNGDWPPHLHLQVMCDLLGHEGDFPGVVDPSRREIFRSICPDPHLLLSDIPDSETTLPRARTEPSLDGLRERRTRILGPSLSLSYRRPLHIVRGFRQFLYASDGQPYLDAVNNVPHVGHAHPRVVAAAAAQDALLNTNTRYLHENLLEYAERLAALFPDPLSVIFLVCSGSEANELALRMSRAATGARGVVALEGGYHGNTTSLVDVSHYKHAGPGGAGAPDWVRIAAMPDPYRGRHRQASDPAAAYAGEVERAARDLAASPHGLAAFLAEPLLGCGGQLVPPAGWLRASFEAVRAAGGVCIADEVQIGLGRVGSHMWAFEEQGALPDVVTLGKPIGNGYPLAAVVTTPEIAAAFANGMEYFNTFGGNPVACAVGGAVLDVLEAEELPASAQRVGRLLLDRLRVLADRHPLVGEARGVGLYLGVELVRDRDSLEPAAVEASYVVNRLRERGILVSTDGPWHNVVKIKPPLCFDMDDAERLAAELDRVLGEDMP